MGVAVAPRLGFRRHLKVDVIAGEGVYLFSERDVTAVQGPVAEMLAPLLDGTRDVAGVLRDIPPHIGTEQAKAALAGLARAGLLGVRTAEAPAGAMQYWDALGVDDASATRAACETVDLTCVGQVDGSAAEAALQAAGLTVSTPGTGSAVSVVLCDDYLSPELAGIDELHRTAGTPWLLAKPTGSRVWIGPLFGPGTACWRCLATRLWGNRQAEAYVQRALGRPGCVPRPQPKFPPIAGTAFNLIALEVAKWLAGYRYPGQRSVWTFDSHDLAGQHHELRRSPQCAGCGDPELLRTRAWLPVPLLPAVARSSNEAFVAAFRHLVSPVTGVVREIVPAQQGPELFHSYRAGPSQALGAHGLESLRAAQRIENGGKGVTAADGEASALGEALERHCGTWHGDEAQVLATYRQLGDRALHPNDCQLYDERQYDGRTAWNAHTSAFQYVCERFDPDAELSWTPVWSVTRGEHRLLPTGMLYYGAPGDAGRVSVTADSNGNAAGSCLSDAVLRGLLELVERDAVAIWWYNRTRHPAVDLDAFADPWVQRLQQTYRDLNRDIWVLDVTADLRVPVFAAVSRRTDKPCEDIMLGFGAHPDPHVALTRALTEMNQLMPVVGHLGPDDDYDAVDKDAVRWWREATTGNQPYLTPADDTTARRPADYAPVDDDPLAQLEDIRARLEERGLELLVLDQTRPDIGVSVVKVLVPGLRHFWARYAPGRLFDVPVQLGRLAERTPYNELNPVPMFL
jgi:ribosomal protein S12 methylthiotransferase accessory factor